MISVFETTLRGFRWLWAHWYIPLFALAAAAAWLVRLRPETPQEAVRDELKGIDQYERIRKIAIDRGAELANAIATGEYWDTIKRMDAEQARLSEALRADPARRLRYLRRLSKRLGERPVRAANNGDQ